MTLPPKVLTANVIPQLSFVLRLILFIAPLYVSLMLISALETAIIVSVILLLT